MRVKEIHPKEERLPFVVFLEPARCGRGCHVHERLFFDFEVTIDPSMSVRQATIVPDRHSTGLVEWHLIANWVVQMEQVFITFLSTMLVRGVKPELEFDC